MTSVASGTLDRLRGTDFLDIAQLEAEHLGAILDLADAMKAGRWSGAPLRGRALALIFQKPSMRTRVSFEVGIQRLGGAAITLSDQDIGLGSRETVQDVARVLDRYVEGIIARLFAHQDLLDLAAASVRPVINALTDGSHPCQILADLMTIREAVGRLDTGTHVAFVGDGNNVARSLIEASVLLGFPLTVVTPPAYEPELSPSAAGGGVHVTSDLAAVAGAAVVYTDVWTSMGQEAETEARRARFAEYQVDDALMELAPDAVFMHCLPAHRGEEVTAGVIDGPRAIVFDQAENRLWAQMALLALIFGEPA
ncbi:MAG TPA: ornithine carbamoyltransferase [Candidatus Dormibacteraeota bacterium]|nr:ornithine carbamoyltransferase [Candidatus Dormibacteraeota bacterium]